MGDLPFQFVGNCAERDADLLYAFFNGLVQSAGDVLRGCYRMKFIQMPTLIQGDVRTEK